MALDRFRAHKANPDYSYLSLVTLLVLFGLVMISSSSVVVASETYNHNYAFVIKQATALGLGALALVVMSRIPYARWREWATPFFIFSLILVLLVFLPGIGKAAKGASRWIAIGSFQLQPSEILKLSFIIYLAAWLEKRKHTIHTFSEGLLPFLVLLAPVVFILVAQRDLGTLLVLLVIGGTMFFMAGASYTQIGTMTGLGVGLVGLLILIEPYRLARLTTFLNPTADKLGSGYHINQSLLAIGAGGLWGRGFGQSLQKYLYLPEPQTDSIFAIIVEELGFLRSSLVLVVIGLLAYRGYQIAFRAADDFSRMVAFGITTWFLFQAFINIAAILGLIPLTGVPLPFISYGGTALILCLVGVGIMINISKYSYGK